MKIFVPAVLLLRIINLLGEQALMTRSDKSPFRADQLSAKLTE